MVAELIDRFHTPYRNDKVIKHCPSFAPLLAQVSRAVTLCWYIIGTSRKLAPAIAKKKRHDQVYARMADTQVGHYSSLIML